MLILNAWKMHNDLNAISLAYCLVVIWIFQELHDTSPEKCHLEDRRQSPEILHLASLTYDISIRPVTNMLGLAGRRVGN